MALNTRSIFDPRWQKGLARVNNGAQTSSVLVRRANNPATVEHPAEWDYVEGKYTNFTPGVNAEYTELWFGPARVQPDKDWRARGYMFGDEATVFQAVRFSMPLNGGTWNPDIDSTEMEFRDQDEILIMQNFFSSLEPILKYVFVIRDPMGSGVSPANNVLTDVNLRGGTDR